MKLTLQTKREEVPGVTSFVFSPDKPIAWKAGQYMHYVLPHDAQDERGAERWFTISSAPYEKDIVITTRIAREKGSSFKKELCHFTLGTVIEADGPEGDFIINDASQEIVFLVGGIGITPVHSILKELDRAKVLLRSTLVYANRDSNFVFQKELDAFAKNNSQLSIHYLVDPERITVDLIQKVVADVSKPHFYISGPEPMAKAIPEILTTLGVPEDHVMLDDFPGYLADA